MRSKQQRRFLITVSTSRPLSERKRVRLHAIVQKLDRESLIVHVIGLTDQLVQALLSNDTDAFRIDIDTVVRSRSGAIEGHTKANRFAIGAWSQDEVQITGMELEHYCSRCAHEHGLVLANQPGPSQAPMIECKPVRHRVRRGLIRNDARGRTKMLGARIAEIGLRR